MPVCSFVDLKDQQLISFLASSLIKIASITSYVQGVGGHFHWEKQKRKWAFFFSQAAGVNNVFQPFN